MEDTRTTFLTGHLVRNQYMVVKLLGQGETGAVYLVTDERNHQQHFALKEVMHVAREERRGFPFDASVLKGLDYPALPHIQQVFHTDDHDRFYILMDYVEGNSLDVMRHLMPGRRFSLQAALALMSPIMDAVSYLHQEHPPLIHGDIKPENIIPQTAGTATPAQLVDFGGGKNLLTGASARQSEYNFRAPEQFGKGTSRRTDVYALGAIFYTLLTGVLPTSASDRLKRIEAGEPDPLVQMNKFMPFNPIVVSAIHCALSISRKDRFASVEEFRQALWQVIHTNEKVTPVSELMIAVPGQDHTVPLVLEPMIALPPPIEEVNTELVEQNGEEIALGERTELAEGERKKRAARHDISRRKVEIPGLVAKAGEKVTSGAAPSRRPLSLASPVAGSSPETVSSTVSAQVWPPLRRRRRRKSKFQRFMPLVLVLLLLSVVGSGVAIAGNQVYNAKYQSEVALARQGIRHLETALSLTEAWSRKPLSASSVSPAQHEFEAARAVFAQLDTNLQSFTGVATLLPGFSNRLGAALSIVQVAMLISQAGVSGCEAINLILNRLHEPFGKQFGLKLGDIVSIRGYLRQVEDDIDQANAQVNALKPADLQFDARVGNAIVAFHKFLPTVQSFLKVTDQLLPVLPSLLGIGPPAYYLVEILDSTELRPGGGFVKDYGFATIIGGRLSTAHISDENLLGSNNQFIPYPSKYRWFDKVSKSWNISDSNLDADFPTDAYYAEQNYNREGGRLPLQGVIAITPALMQEALAITGPIAVPELRQTVTATNLIHLIHQFEPWLGNLGGSTPGPHVSSAGSRQFTELLAEHFINRFRQIRSSELASLIQMLVTSLRTKDLQLYFNATPAQSLLQLSHVDATIQAPVGDSLFVVDANTSANNANQFITGTLDDQVTIDANGDALHRTSIHYNWLYNGYVYGSPDYSDYVRIYVPLGSSLLSQKGWQSRGTSEAFGREVWAGSFTLSSGKVNTISLAWIEKSVAKKNAVGWHYQYLVQRQASANWRLNVQVALPACTVKAHTTVGVVSQNGRFVTLNQSLTQDTNLAVDYSC